MSTDYGKAVVNGVARYTSASSLTKADPNSYAGCLRAWWYEKVAGKYGETTAAMTRGTKQLHEPIELYLKTGQRAIPPLVMPVLPFVPERGPDLLIEQEIAIPVGQESPKVVDPSRSPLKAAGLPLVGRIDLTHARGVYIDSDGTLKQEPNKHTVEVIDWKSTSNKGYAKQADELRRTIQMVSYAKWATLLTPRVEHVRVAHVYTLTRGAPEAWKVHALTDREEIERGWNYIEGVARTMQDAARETNPDNVEPNRRSCDSYARGCPHKSYCSVGKHNSLTDLFGEQGAAALLQESEKSMSLLFKSLKTTEGVGVSATLPTPATSPLSMLDQLEAEERAALAKTTAAVVAPPAPALDPALAEAFKTIDGAGMGSPVFVGRAAQARCAYIGHAFDGHGLAGSGRLAGLNQIEDPNDVLGLAQDLRDRAARQAPAAIPATLTTTVHIAQPVDILPPEAPVSIPPPVPPKEPETVAEKIVDLAANGVLPPLPPKRGRGRPPKAKADPTDVSVGTAANSAEVGGTVRIDPPLYTGKVEPGREPAGTITLTDGTPVEYEALPQATEKPFALYIDCVPSEPYEALDPHIASWCTALVKYFGLDKAPNVPDIRAASKDVSQLAYGAWKGTLAAFVRDTAEQLPRGNYVLHTANSEINTEVANALVASGKLDRYVRGVR